VLKDLAVRNHEFTKRLRSASSAEEVVVPVPDPPKKLSARATLKKKQVLSLVSPNVMESKKKKHTAVRPSAVRRLQEFTNDQE
jgi:hypothetical protein